MTLKSLAFGISLFVAWPALSNQNTLSSMAVTKPSGDYQTENYRIERILERESRVQTVSEAINMKRRGLIHVYDLYDFALLTSTPFPSPSDAYKRALDQFVLDELPAFLNDRMNFRALLDIEENTYYVPTSIKVKELALEFTSNILDFSRIAVQAHTNPSESYLSALSTFIATNVARVITPESPIHAILRIESNTKIVSDAIAVKEAGLVAATNRRKFWALTDSAFESPSRSYLNAVDQFINRHRDQYGK